MAEPEIRRVFAAPGEAAIVKIRAGTLRAPYSNEAVVRTRAFSVNRGELGRAKRATKADYHIGWDFVGAVERGAADGSGPGVGTRVVGFSTRMEGWAELVPIPTSDIAPVLDGVSDAQAATLPVAGMTALHAVDAATGLLGRKALVTGATGGVGMFAVQLARLAGADVCAQIRREDQRAFLEELGECTPVVTPDGATLEQHGPFRLIVDGVSGPVLENALRAIAPDGVCVCYGVTAAPDITVNISDFMRRGLANVMGFHLYGKGESSPAAENLPRLLRLVEAGRLNCVISREASWSEIDTVAAELLDRRYLGKAVLYVD
ncbi:MAG: zinc-binding dehydrogenase [Alphaproteobacteria bacterium]|nr:zinc-binding dehydrogenase [Alphaproteobacteria bacterium]